MNGVLLSACCRVNCPALLNVLTPAGSAPRSVWRAASLPEDGQRGAPGCASSNEVSESHLDGQRFAKWSTSALEPVSGSSKIGT